MKFTRILIVAAIAGSLAACATGRTGNRSLEEYCSIGDNAGTDICKVNAAGVDRDNKTRALAQQGVDAAGRAQTTADAALARQDGVFCETRTFNRTNTASCGAGYTLVGCAQSRYTYRAGGPTVMRDMDDQSCRFATRVLEIKARCCMVGASRAPTEPTSAPMPEQQQQPAPERTS